MSSPPSQQHRPTTTGARVRGQDGSRRPFTLPTGALGAGVALIVLVIGLALTDPFFLTSANILNVLASNSPMLLVATGLTFVLLSGGFDLSVGATMAMSSVAAYLLLDMGVSALSALLLSLVLGTLVGALLNGLLIGRVGLNFLVVTLGSMSFLGGLVNVVTDGRTYSLPPTQLFSNLGSGRWLGIQVVIYIGLVAVAAAWYVLNMTSYGRSIYAVGGNREAARIAGINVQLVVGSVYAIAGLCSAMAGIIVAGRLGAASPAIGSDIALTAGAAVLLGGTSFAGGVGGIGGTVLGVLLIAFLQNGLGLMGVSPFWQSVVTGAVLVAAVALDRAQRGAR